MPQISVIVPVYKVETYLPACVESILTQTFRDFELILVDDGSPDNCGVLCDAYAARDPRVRVIHRENGGLCFRPRRRPTRRSPSAAPWFLKTASRRSSRRRTPAPIGRPYQAERPLQPSIRERGSFP